MSLIQLLAGLGIFLYGMSQLEDGIQTLFAQRIRQWLARATARPWHSALTGLGITAILQSSSMVSLLTQAFAAAQLIPLYNALGIIFGANLGSTMTGWLVTALGFKLDLDAVALPIVGAGGLMAVFAGTEHRWSQAGRALLGLGLMLFGLGVMKSAVSALPQNVDITLLAQLGGLGFLLVGMVLTAIIQSSAATVMVALTALNSGLISLGDAGALVIGADLGTTSTAVLGALRGSVVKKQLALAHISFNVVVDSLAFILLLPLLPRLTAALGFQEPLFALVAFHSSFNLVGVVLFLPWTRRFAGWLSRFFKTDHQANGSLYLEPQAARVPAAGIGASLRELRRLGLLTVALNRSCLGLPREVKADNSSLPEPDRHAPSRFEERYEQLKQLESALHRYAVRIQGQQLAETETMTLQQILESARDFVFAAKSIKDIRHDLGLLREGGGNLRPEAKQQILQQENHFYREVARLLEETHQPDYLREQIEQLDRDSHRWHDQRHRELLTQLTASSDPTELSSLLNINRELRHAHDNVLRALKISLEST